MNPGATVRPVASMVRRDSTGQETNRDDPAFADCHIGSLGRAPRAVNQAAAADDEVEGLGDVGRCEHRSIGNQRRGEAGHDRPDAGATHSSDSRWSLDLVEAFLSLS
jgi:hypothetical protein